MEVQTTTNRYLKIILIAAIGAYACLLSFAVMQVIDGGVSPRLKIILELGWVFAILTCLVLIGWALSKKSAHIRGSLDQIAALPFRLKYWLRILIYVVLLLFPIYLSFSGISRGVTDSPGFRSILLIPFLLVTSLFFPSIAQSKYSFRLVLTMLFSAYLFLAAGQLVYVVNYPFSLTWSEGNRLYDYSLIFAKSLYPTQVSLTIPYFSPGRFGLWGIWFLIPNLPIWFHRLWNALLWILPPLIFGWICAKGTQPRITRFALAVWLALFLYQGPIYAPLLIAAILTVMIDRVELWKRAIPTGIASLYAGLSRWTWSLSPGVWAGLIDIDQYFPQRSGSWFSRILPAIILGLVGSIPGLLSNYQRWTNLRQSTLSLSQPLLFYRLFPNPTYPNGILLSLLIATGPVILLLCWLAASRRWKLTWTQIIVSFGVCFAFLIAGLVASIKIGGGNNLHNMDMFLITIVILISQFLRRGGLPSFQALPNWVKTFAVLAFLVPIWSVSTQTRPLIFPPQEYVQKALNKIKTNVDKAGTEVLFIDQRQLLTFGEIRSTNLVPDYEKNYLMDQAMAGNSAYFQQFYADLAKKRFNLIITEPLYTNPSGTGDSFGEENAAWVKWVSNPVLCYYKSFKLYKKVKVQLLIPRENVENCDLMVQELLSSAPAISEPNFQFYSGEDWP